MFLTWSCAEYVKPVASVNPLTKPSEATFFNKVFISPITYGPSEFFQVSPFIVTV
jgi:hypothetical protein